MSNGITGLRGYQQGDLVEDSPGWFERLRERGRQTPGYHSSSPIRIPLAYRQFFGDLVGKQFRERLGMEGLGNLIGSRDITAGDMSPAELSALQDAVLRGMGGTLQDKSSLEYADYATAKEGEDQYSDVGGGKYKLMASRMLDPSYSMKMTFGQAEIRKDPDTGEYYLTDQYNFNPKPGEQPRSEPTQFGDFLDEMADRVSYSGMYGYPRAVGQAYGSVEGEGSRARVNLGNLEEALARSRGEEQPSRLTRGLGWLRDFFDGDRDAQVAEAEPGRAPVAAPQVDELAELKARLQILQDPSIQ